MSWARSTCCSIALTLATLACAEQHEPVPIYDQPIGSEGSHVVVLHRPMAVGTVLQVDGEFWLRDTTIGMVDSRVVIREHRYLVVEYVLLKEILAVGLNGAPRAVRYEIVEMSSYAADEPPVGERGSQVLGKPEVPLKTSGGQSFVLVRDGNKVELRDQLGTLTPAEKAAVTHGLGPSYELAMEGVIVQMFGTDESHRAGELWDIDKKLAGALMAALLGTDVSSQSIEGHCELVEVVGEGKEQFEHIRGEFEGRGIKPVNVGQAFELTDSRIKMTYSGVFPQDLEQQPREQNWSFQASLAFRDVINGHRADFRRRQQLEHYTRIAKR